MRKGMVRCPLCPWPLGYSLVRMYRIFHPLGSTEEDAMAFHHVAIATHDLAKAHAFYEDAMGFRLVHAEAGLDVMVW